MINGRAGSSLEQQAFNWKDPAQYNYTYNGSFTYNADGTQFTGTNHIRTSLIPLTALTGTTTDVAVVNVVGTNPTPAGIIFGNVGNNFSSLYTQLTTVLFYDNIYAGKSE